MKDQTRTVVTAMAAVSLIAGAACGQVSILRNDSAQIPLPSGQSFPAAIQVGFGPGEEAMSIYSVSPNITFPARVTSIGILWYSNTNILLQVPVEPTIQDGFKLWAGSSADPRLMSVVGMTSPVQLSDGGYNIIDLVNPQPDGSIEPPIVFETRPNFIGCSLVFDTEPTSGNWTNGAPAGNTFAASVCYDRTASDAFNNNDSNRNWIFASGTTNTSTGLRSGWIRYRDLRTASNAAPAGYDLVLRINLEPYTPPPPPVTCIADRDGDQTVDGSDFIMFINSFAIGDAAVDSSADLAGGGDPNLPEGGPDGTIDGTDFIAFINAFGAGC